ncbi:MAG: hypothetical protein WDN45_02550 [Caulobacteraceae bacterium]
MTNILRDLDEDAGIGRLYVPPPKPWPSPGSRSRTPDHGRRSAHRHGRPPDRSGGHGPLRGRRPG